MSAFRIALVCLSCFVAAGFARAGEIEVYLNDDAARGTYTFLRGGSDLAIDLGILHDSDVGELFHLGAGVSGLAGDRVEASLGGRLLIAETDLDDGAAIALGGSVDAEIRRVVLGAFAYYAPSSTSFGSVDDMLDVGASVGYRVLPSGTVFLAWTKAEADFEADGAVTLDEGLHAGFRVRF